MLITENMPKSNMKNGNATHWHLGSLASPGDREESASHHVSIRIYIHRHEILCASTKILVLEWSFGVRRSGLGVKFHDFLKMPWITQDVPGMLPSNS